jgi:molecular chaperone GrpE
MTDKLESQEPESTLPEMKSEAEAAPKDLQTLTDELAEAQAKAAEHWDHLLRTQAEMENLKRRSERDMVNAHKFALEKFIKNLLPILDSLEMALQATAPTEAKSAFEGVALTHKMFLDMLEKQGVKQLNPMGENFNPHEHQAVTTQVKEEVAPNTILAVMQKGYALHERVIRPALVMVSAKP